MELVDIILLPPFRLGLSDFYARPQLLLTPRALPPPTPHVPTSSSPSIPQYPAPEPNPTKTQQLKPQYPTPDPRPTNIFPLAQGPVSPSTPCQTQPHRNPPAQAPVSPSIPPQTQPHKYSPSQGPVSPSITPDPTLQVHAPISPSTPQTQPPHVPVSCSLQPHHPQVSPQTQPPQILASLMHLVGDSSKQNLFLASVLQEATRQVSCLLDVHGHQGHQSRTQGSKRCSRVASARHAT